MDASRSTRFIAVVLAVAALYLARSILIPAALAVLLTFLLRPVVHGLERARFNRLFAVILTVLLATAITGSVGLLVTRQVVDLSTRLPDYKQNLLQKVQSFRESGQKSIARLTGTLSELKEELSATQPSTQPRSAASVDRAAEPLRVQVVDNGPDVNELVVSITGPLLGPMESAGITILLLIFLLWHSDDVRERAIAFAGMRQISLTTRAAGEISERIGRYLRMQLLVNCLHGTMVAIGLYFLGLPNALLWGVFSMLLRFVPYVGPWIAGLLPTLLAAAIFPGWKHALGVIALLIVAEGITNLGLEPWLYGASAGVSSLGVVCGAMFWAWLWGPLGLILATPMTVCLMVIGKHVPQLALFNQIFGTDTQIPAAGRLYQRLLVEDAPAAERMITESLETTPLAQLCDELLLPVLAELKRDHLAGRVNAMHADRSMQILESILPAEQQVASAESGPRLICIAGQNDIDACAARLLAVCAQQRGILAEALSADVLASEAADLIDSRQVSHAAIVQVLPISAVHSRRLIKAIFGRVERPIEVIDLCASCAMTEMPPTRLRDAQVRHEHSFAHLVTQLAEQTTFARRPVEPAVDVK